MSLPQLRSVFRTCFADTDEHTTQSQSPCTAAQGKRNQNNKTQQKPDPKAPGGRWQAPALPPEGSARGWGGLEGKELPRSVSSPLILPPGRPAAPPFHVPLPGGGRSQWHPLLLSKASSFASLAPKIHPQRRQRTIPLEEGGWGRGDPPSLPGWVPAHPPACPQSIQKRASFPPPFLPSFCPSFLLPFLAGKRGAPS